jgi:ABC-type multidrug transport system ATPase subunit
MMLVLGRPGSGCTTFLKTIANDRKTYSGVKGSIHYGHIPADQQASRYRGEVVYCSEDDVHFSALSVWRTVVFALWNKTKKKDEHAIPHIGKALLRMFGLSHAKNTFVGDAFLRGVSGGERKRVCTELLRAGSR